MIFWHRQEEKVQEEGSDGDSAVNVEVQEPNTQGDGAYIAKVMNGIPILGYAQDPNRPPPPSTAPKTVAMFSLPDAPAFAKLVRLAGPTFFCVLGKIVCYSAVPIRAAGFGITQLTAHNVMMRVFLFYATFGDSVSQASQTFAPGVISSADVVDDDDEKSNEASIRKLVRQLVTIAIKSRAAKFRTLLFSRSFHAVLDGQAFQMGWMVTVAASIHYDV